RPSRLLDSATTRVVHPGPWLPNPKDETVDAYADRLRRTLGNTRFGVQANGLETVPAIRRCLAPFLEAALAFAGTPRCGIDVIGFLGNYRRTPFGAHRDSHHVLTFVSHGEKSFATWHRSQLRHRREVGDHPRSKFVV